MPFMADGGEGDLSEEHTSGEEGGQNDTGDAVVPGRSEQIVHERS